MKSIRYIIFIIINSYLYIFSDPITKTLNNGELIVTYYNNKIKSIETKNIKRDFRFGFKKFNLMENSMITFDESGKIDLDKGVIVFSNYKNNLIDYKMFFNNSWGNAQFLRLEFSAYVEDMSSDTKIIYYEENKNWTLNTKLHFLFRKDKRFYYGFFIPYSIFNTIQKIDIDITIYSKDKIYSQIKLSENIQPKEWQKQVIKFSPKKSKELIESKREKFEEERKKRWKIWERNPSVIYFKDGYKYPVDDIKYMTSDFGLIREWRLNNGKLYSKDVHTGIDYANLKGTPVYACGSGIVKYAEYGEYVGNMIIIEHGLGLCSGYMHLDSILVSENQFVKKGEEIGKMGATGAATGSHIHWETRIYGISVDPRTLFDIEKIFE